MQKVVTVVHSNFFVDAVSLVSSAGHVLSMPELQEHPESRRLHRGRDGEDVLALEEVTRHWVADWRRLLSPPSLLENHVHRPKSPPRKDGSFQNRDAVYDVASDSTKVSDPIAPVTSDLIGL